MKNLLRYFTYPSRGDNQKLRLSTQLVFQALWNNMSDIQKEISGIPMPVFSPPKIRLVGCLNS